MNPNNIYIICIKDLISNKWRHINQIKDLIQKIKEVTIQNEKI